jgi:hypothetical protein
VTEEEVEAMLGGLFLCGCQHPALPS